MIKKTIQLCALALITFTMHADAAQQGTQAQQKPAVNKSNQDDTTQNEGTYKDEVEIMKFDEYTGRDTYAVPTDESWLERKQGYHPSTK